MAIRKPRFSDVVRRRLTRVVEAALKPMREGSSAACPERSVKPYRMARVLAQAACKTLAGLAAGFVASYLHALGLALFPLVEDVVGRYDPTRSSWVGSVWSKNGARLEFVRRTFRLIYLGNGGILRRGEVAERLKAPHSKCDCSRIGPYLSILASP